VDPRPALHGWPEGQHYTAAGTPRDTAGLKASAPRLAGTPRDTAGLKASAPRLAGSPRDTAGLKASATRLV
jgi:hypothetical protein